ncbi:MAG: hypothetical protein KatS3mg032_0927 [Cyclobacteriaceae bacterium]|nr:MAG: hypothetical protein KatS3mg032_0927 [Cyclobacteriaceae bacterium]
MNKLQKLRDLLSKEKSGWHTDVEWRNRNADWIDYSFNIAVRILETLDALGMTQKELALKLGVTPQYVNRIVKGKENLSLETIAALEKALEVKLITIVDEKALNKKFLELNDRFKICHYEFKGNEFDMFKNCA